MTTPIGTLDPQDVARSLVEVLEHRIRQDFVQDLAYYTWSNTTRHTDDIDQRLRSFPQAVAGRRPGELAACMSEVLALRADEGTEEQPRAAETADMPGASRWWGEERSRARRVAGRLDPCGDPCAVAHVEPCMPEISHVHDGDATSAVTLAGVLATCHLLGDYLGVFRAVDTAIARLDKDLVVDDDLLDDLSCWPEIGLRIREEERSRLVARVLGLKTPGLPAGVAVDATTQDLLNDLVNAIGLACEHARRYEPGPAELDALNLARETLVSRLTTSASQAARLQIIQLQIQTDQAQRILAELAPSVVGPSRRTRRHDAWASVRALNGDRLADGTDLSVAVSRATAWRTVFVWLAEPVEAPEGELCRAAARLHPRRRHAGSTPTGA